MVLETVGVIKTASALKCAAVGLAAATPTLVSNSAIAAQQLVTVATPVIVHGAIMLGVGLTSLVAATGKGIVALKGGMSALAGSKFAGGTVAGRMLWMH